MTYVRDIEKNEEPFCVGSMTVTEGTRVGDGFRP